MRGVVSGAGCGELCGVVWCGVVSGAGCGVVQGDECCGERCCE